eukprot:Phypoly_transcript_04868.p1 GENE.Phypoly_transcript_04868~~Phypoly_transcript_04868.p1  ORF type:complete len:623 (+),score=119.09 Phypoly_transcript_04868:78-1946(+)
MGQVETRPEQPAYPNSASNSPKYRPQGPPPATISNVTPASPRYPAASPRNDVSSNTILGTLGEMDHREFNMEVVVNTNDPPNPTEKNKSSPKLLGRGRSGSKSNGSTSPKKLAKQGFKPIPPLSISEMSSPSLDVQDGSDLIPRPTTPKSIPRGSSPKAMPRSASPNNIFGTLAKAFSVGNVSGNKSPRDISGAPKLSKSAESASYLDTEILFTSENDDRVRKSGSKKRVTFALDTNDLETHVQEEQGVEFPKISVIPWYKLRDKGIMSEGPHFTLTKVLLYGNVYVQKSINCPEGQAPPLKTVQKLHHEVEILAMMHHHINIVDFVGITISPLNQLSFLTKHCPFSLQGVLDRNMAFDFKGIAYGVLKGIQYVHSCGFVLGDLKPDKIWLDRNETPKLVDFGNSLSVKDACESNKIVGTIGYMAPEIFLKNAIQTPQALDIFSYGAVLHYMVTRIDPACKVTTVAPGKSITEVARENANTPFDFTKISEPALRVLLTACLRINPAERPTTRRALELLSFVKYKWHPDPTAETRKKRVPLEDEEDEDETKPQNETHNQSESENEGFETDDDFDLNEDDGENNQNEASNTTTTEAPKTEGPTTELPKTEGPKIEIPTNKEEHK